MFKKQQNKSCIRLLPKRAQQIFTARYNEAMRLDLGHDLATQLAWEEVKKYYVFGKRHWIKRRIYDSSAKEIADQS